MRRKYATIFLMGLLCLVSSNLFSQHCFKMSYDKNGNRVCFMTKECDGIERGELNVDDVLFDECVDDAEELLVYPNPNNGSFKVELKNVETDGVSNLHIYDNKGILVFSQKFFEEFDIDISNNPAGVYLLRIIGENSVRSVIVVKY